MSEKLTAKQAAEQLLYKPEYAADKPLPKATKPS